MRRSRISYLVSRPPESLGEALRAGISTKGFTLIELLVVIAIIGILATVVTVSSSSARAQARDSQRKADAQNVAAALEVYRATNRSYPDVQSRSGSWAVLKGQLYPDYISSWPEDPKAASGTLYTYISNAPSLAASGRMFAIDVALENSDERITAPEIVEAGNAQSDVFLSGTYQSTAGPIVNRVSGR